MGQLQASAGVSLGNRLANLLNPRTSSSDEMGTETGICKSEVPGKSAAVPKT